MNTYKPRLLEILIPNLPLEAEQIETLLTKTQDTSKGHFTMPCFALAKTLRKNPKMIAEELAAQIPTGDFLAKVEAVNGYLNFFLHNSQLLKDILGKIAKEKNTFGNAPSNGKTVVVDYSSPNIGKQLAFHHLRSTMIGNSLYKTYKAAGWKAEGVNHLGDWGTQFGKLIVMFKRNHPSYSESDLKTITLADLNAMYVDFGKVAKKDETLEDQAREAFRKMEAGDEESLTLWQAFKDVTLKELDSLYKLMGVSFDHYTGEAFFNNQLDAVVEELKNKELLSVSQEREVVLLEEEEMPPCLIRKSDGSSLYATRDLAAALYRKKEFDFDRCLYIVDNGQALHFKQVFKVLEKAGHQWHEALKHIPFGLILHWNEKEEKWSKGSSKMGNSNTLREVFDAAAEKILQFIEEKNPELEDKKDVAYQIGVGALVFNDLKNKRLMDVKFDWDKALSFEGDTGPYVQNAHVRMCSIMRKAGYTATLQEVDFNHIQDEVSLQLVQTLALLPAKIQAVTEVDEPYILTQFSLQIAEQTHRFIARNRVLGSEEEKSRLFVIQCAQQVLENTLNLIGVSPLRYM